MAKKQIFEITGIGFPNKGAELMLIAAAQQIRARKGSDAIISCAPTNGSDVGYRCLSQHGIHMRTQLSFRGYEIGKTIGNCLPQKVLRTFGCVAGNEVNTVLDASGLKYSDSFGDSALSSSMKNLKYYRDLKNRGGKLVLLPQAFGPFKNKKLRFVCREIFSLADIIFARDNVSYKYLVELVGEQKKLQVAPDFTILVDGIETERTKTFKEKIGIIPNNQMFRGKSDKEVKDYIRSLLRIATQCRQKGYDIYLLNHEGLKDQMICETLRNELGKNTLYAKDLSALEIKAVIANSMGIITSRFHGLVSALSQGIPSLATSWSHKYEELCEEYQTQESILKPGNCGNNLDIFFEKILHTNKNKKASTQIKKTFKNAHELWCKVFNVI